MEPSIVHATLDDIELVAPLFDAYRQSSGQVSDVEGARRFISERLEQKQSVIFLALKNGVACGFAQLYPSFSSTEMRLVWILNDLFVAPEARRLGIGRNLIQWATEFANETGAKRLVLATAVDNRPAQLLYEKLGWINDDAFLHYKYEL